MTLFFGKKVHYYFSLALTCIVYMFSFNNVYAVEPVSIDLSVNTATLQPFSKRVFGVHGELLWSPVRYNDPVLANIFHDLGFTSIRFPGGTTANYYLSRSNNFGCNKSMPTNSRPVKRVEAFNNALKGGKRTYSTKDFIEFLKRTHADFTLVLNVYCDDVESAIQWIKEFADSGIKVNKVELGNELYYKEYFWVFKKPGDYTDIANKFSIQIKKYYPDIEVAYIASSSVFQSKYYPDMSRMHKSKHYNYGLKLDFLSSTATKSDALATHFYSSFGLSKLERIFGLVDNEEIYKKAVAHFDRRSKDAITYFNELGLHKKIWVTEWGILFYGDTLKYEKDFQLSIYNALFMVNGLIKFSNSQEVAEAYYHNLPSFIANKEGYIKSIYNVSAIKLFKNPVSEALGVNEVKVKGMLTHESDYSDFPGKNNELNFVYFTGENEDFLIVVNKFVNDYRVNSLKSISGKLLTPTYVDQITKYSSDIIRLDNEKEITFPGYSITKITIKKL